MTEDPSDLESTELASTAIPDHGFSAESRQIGPYRLLEKIGEGGMGQVWLADQATPVRRRVALKLIKQGMDTKRVVARFETERQALAMMDHPAVAKVFDAGVTGRGTPYFVMEHVKGVPITEHCDRHRLTTRERVGLFIQVCEGVQHAHQKAVIHRDLKPSNVLVSIQDNRGAPKIIDFGVAKAIDHRLTEHTVYTELGTLIGTPEYMSPEQAEMTGQDVDTRTDVYSLGVMLYELLVGSLPFGSLELRRSGFDGFRRKIREEDPPRPSVRLASLERPRSAESARVRSTDPPALRRQLRGDLDWITMKALEKDRTRRYGSPAELAADLRRYLADEPVLASPPTALYRMRKFARRHRSGVGFATAAILVLLAFAATMTLQAGRISRERDRAEAKHLLALARLAMSDDPSVAMAYVIESLETVDDPETRRLAVELVWLGPLRTQLPNGRGYGVGFSPDGRWLAASDYGRATVWSEDGTSVDLELANDSTMELRFGPSSTRLAVALGGGRDRIGIWSVPGWQRLDTLDFGTDTGFWWAGSVSSLVIAALDRQNQGQSTWYRWSPKGGAPSVVGHLSRAAGSAWVSPALDPSGRWLAYADDREVRVLPVEDLDASAGTLVGRHGESVSALTFHPDGDRIASVGRSGEIRIWSRSAGPGAEPRVLSGELDVIALRFDPSGGKLVTVGMGAELWDLNAAPDAEPVVIDSQPVDMPGASFHPSGQSVAIVSSSKANIWSVARPFPQVLLGHPGKEALDVEFSTDGRWIASASADGTVRTWPLALEAGRGNRVLLETRGDFVEPTRVAVDPAGRYVATATLGGEVWVLPLDGKPARRLSGFNGVLHTIAVGPQGRFVASSGGAYGRRDEALIRVWDLETGDVTVLDRGDGEFITCLAFTADGGLLSSSRNGLDLWDVRTGKRRSLFPQRIRNFALSDVGTLVGAAGQVGVVDLATGSVQVLEAHGSKAEAVAISADGSRTASAGADGVIRILSESGQEPHLLIGHRGPVDGLAFSPDGRTLASAGNDGTIRLWPLPQGAPLQAYPQRRLLAFLRGLTNLRAVPDPESSTGYSVRPVDFTGWRIEPGS